MERPTVTAAAAEANTAGVDLRNLLRETLVVDSLLV
jgi:hypothetical protein